MWKEDLWKGNFFDKFAWLYCYVVCFVYMDVMSRWHIGKAEKLFTPSNDRAPLIYIYIYIFVVTNVKLFYFFVFTGDLLAGEMSAKFRSTGYWRTPLQITAGIYLAVLAPFSIFMSPKERRQGAAGQSFQQRKPRRSWATSVTLDSGRSDNESRLQRASSSDLSLDGSKASVRTNPPNGRLKTLSCSDCNTLLLFASVILPPMTWFVHWFGMVRVTWSGNYVAWSILNAHTNQRRMQDFTKDEKEWPWGLWRRFLFMGCGGRVITQPPPWN